MLGCEWCVLKGASLHGDVLCACPGTMVLFAQKALFCLVHKPFTDFMVNKLC